MNKIYSDRYIISFLILVILNITLNSCYVFRETEIRSGDVIKIFKIEMIDGEIIDFKNTKLGYGFISGDKIVAIEKNGENKEILLSKIKKTYTEKFDIGNTFFLVIGIVGVFNLVLIGLFWIGVE
jgi:hypothetical protein